jgi:hypothetical protein
VCRVTCSRLYALLPPMVRLYAAAAALRKAAGSQADSGNVQQPSQLMHLVWDHLVEQSSDAGNAPSPTHASNAAVQGASPNSVQSALQAPGAKKRTAHDAGADDTSASAAKEALLRAAAESTAAVSSMAGRGMLVAQRLSANPICMCQVDGDRLAVGLGALLAQSHHSSCVSETMCVAVVSHI